MRSKSLRSQLPPGLVESSELPEPIFTPATKAESGHDINISFDEAAARVGREHRRNKRGPSASKFTKRRGSTPASAALSSPTRSSNLACIDGQLMLIDEVLTPDSSRFWPADSYQPGGPQPSFDKQFVRDYLETLDWDKTPPAPALPPDIVAKTQEKYLEAYGD